MKSSEIKDGTKFKQRIPGGCDQNIPIDECIVRSLEELEKVPVVSRFMAMDNFDKLAIDYNERRDNYMLMGIYDEGRKWWVIGYLSGSDTFGIPEWNRP